MQTHSKVRLAVPSDEPEILHLCRMMHEESGRGRLDMDCVRGRLALAFDKKGGILAVIGIPGQIRAMQMLLITQEWYTRDSHLEEQFNWVHPDHRHSDYSRLLVEHAKKCSDELSARAGEKIPLIISVLTTKRMAAKVRLYRRFLGLPYGAIFLHNGTWVNKDEPCAEDFWRVPSIAKMFFKREERSDKRERTRLRA